MFVSGCLGICVDARQMARLRPLNILHSIELKAFVLLSLRCEDRSMALADLDLLAQPWMASCR